MLIWVSSRAALRTKPLIFFLNWPFQAFAGAQDTDYHPKALELKSRNLPYPIQREVVVGWILKDKHREVLARSSLSPTLFCTTIVASFIGHCILSSVG